MLLCCAPSVDSGQELTTDLSTPDFKTLHEAFEFCKPNKSLLISDHHQFALVARKLIGDEGDDDIVWSHLDQDGNGHVSFPEFVEWAERSGCTLPTGIGGGGAGEAFPPTWSGPKDDETWDSRDRVADLRELEELQELLNVSYKNVYTRDRRKTGRDDVPKSFKLVKALKSENYKDWRGYYMKRHLLERQVKDKTDGGPEFQKIRPLTADAKALCGKRHRLRGYVNEWFLFHGTSAEAAEAISAGDFTMALAGSATGTMYGKGTYLAESITKADEYAKEGPDGTCCVLVCRTIGGVVLYNDDVSPDPDDLTRKAMTEGYHCILGDREKCRGTFKEYVVFDADQIFIAYVIFYRREYD